MNVAVLSGKGGTGKTLVSVNLAFVANTATYLDCDVEEPNGHLFFKPVDVTEEKVLVKIPIIDQMLCSGCRKCVDFCKFNAMAFVQNKVKIFEEICHSCGGCALICPDKAIAEKEKYIGRIQKGHAEGIQILSGFLNTGQASGVPIIKGIMDRSDFENELRIVDCPPGSACIVMESIKNADYCVIVAEPTLFGLHNMEMIYDLVKVFNKPHGVILNKCLEEENPSESFCISHDIKILGKIPFEHQLGMLNSNGYIVSRENVRYKRLFKEMLAIIIGEVPV